MMRLLVLGLAFALAAPAGAATTVAGRWSAAAASNGRAVLELRYSESSDHGSDSSEASLAAPEAAFGPHAERLSAPPAPVAFDLVREPGTFACTGTAGRGSGAGPFVFTPAAGFGDALAARGFGRPAPDQALMLALDDMTLAFVDRFIRPGNPRATVGDLVRLAEHGVTPDDVAALTKRGASLVTVNDMIAVRDHGVTTALLDALAANGTPHSSADDLIRLADHGVGADYLAALRRFGYGGLSVAQYSDLADHGVTSAYVGGLAKRGYPHVPVDGLIALADHGVTTAFIDRMQVHGYRDVSVADLIRLRDSGL